MSNTMAIGGTTSDQPTGYNIPPTSYNSPVPQNINNPKPPLSSNGMEKSDSGGKEAQNGQGGWAAAMEAYYKTGTPTHTHPGGYYGSHMAPPHHPYMWGAQQMIPPYGSTPPAHYGYGAMYAPQQHPSMVAHQQGSTPYGYTATPPIQSQTKDGMAISAPPSSNQNPMRPSVMTTAGAMIHEQSPNDASSGGSDEDGRGSKRNFDALAVPEGTVTMSTPSNGGPGSQFPYSSELWAMGAPVQRSQVNDVLGGDVANVPYQDDRELKRQRRKQSNRESARRSRLRKQAECEDLGIKVTSLNTENEAFRKEIAELKDLCARLTAENAHLKAKLKGAGVNDNSFVNMTETALTVESRKIESDVDVMGAGIHQPGGISLPGSLNIEDESKSESDQGVSEPQQDQGSQ